VTIHRSSKLESLRVKDGMVEYVLSDCAGKTETFVVERALIATGRAPNLAGLGLERVGVKTERGGIVAQDTRSSVLHIYAAGDVTADVALVNVAELEARHAVERMGDLDPPPLSYESLSTIMFLRPEVASVGLNETQAKAKGIPYYAAILSNALINRCIAMRETDGFIKLLATRAPPHKVLGLRVVGAEASSTIQGIALLIELCATLEVLNRSVHPHPAVTEGVQECARLILGNSIMKPEVFGGEGLVRLVEG
jgi:dihydrolipoamide dehydrogenase